MLPLATDEDVNGHIVGGLLARDSTIDLVTAQAAGLLHRPDPEILEWAAHAGRVLITHDENTMVGHAWDRVRAGQPMPGVILCRQSLPIGDAIDELHVIAICGDAADFVNQVRFLRL